MMRNYLTTHGASRKICLALALPAMLLLPLQAAITRKVGNITRSGTSTVSIELKNQRRLILDFYGDNIFRLFCDPAGGELRDPQAKPEAQILVENPRTPIAEFNTKEFDGLLTVTTRKIKVEIDNTTGQLKVTNRETSKVVINQIEPTELERDRVSITLGMSPTEYFYGGGMQNGRFSHRGKVIQIVNSNNWTDGGVASPTPYYWSTNGYGIMWYTFKPGRYDFGADEVGKVKLSHDESYLDLFFMINEGAVPLLNDFYQLTGNPVLLPKFAFYQGHLNAYNRDYWAEVEEGGIFFEDGKRYKESQTDNGGIRESLNGELNNYQFSARAVIDRYNTHDMPLGWLLPNDGYGAGYGQTGTLDGNIENLKSLGDYARDRGVEIGMWTQSDLHPKEGVEALLQRDIVKEVRDAGVRALKTDVAWVGAGYSFGLNGVADVAKIIPREGNNARPFIITLDGWAGTQRYAGLWSGDQSGGNWEYIRFHIPTYIGTGLSGQPNVSSDMDGIFGGKNLEVNIRDFQWKTWTPMELNMDGWGANEKYPHALGEPATSINRWYLKMKSELMPYTYSIARQAVTGLPMVRAMMLHYPNEYTLGKATQYQFMFGPYFLIAPIYRDTKMDKEGNDIRHGIYLPEGEWIDYLTGELYQGGSIINHYDAPIWKLPVFVKRGAIISMTNPNNNPSQINKKLRIYDLYPAGESSFIDYDDDGVTEGYRHGELSTTEIRSTVVGEKVTIVVEPTEGYFNGMERNKATEFRVNVTKQPKKVTARVGKKKIRLKKIATKEEFEVSTNSYFYDIAPNLNRFATDSSEFAKIVICKNPQLLVKLSETDVVTNPIELTVEGYHYSPDNHLLKSEGVLTAPMFTGDDNKTTAYTIEPTWKPVANADYYEIEYNGMIYSTIKDTLLLFDDLRPETNYSFDIRAVNKSGKSPKTTYVATTKANPLEWALRNVQATISCTDQGGQEIAKLFDFDESNGWHTKWGTNSVPFEIDINLRGISELDKLLYLPREGGGNGVLRKGTISYSLDKENWTKLCDFEWANNDTPKEVLFEGKPKVQYIKIAVTQGNGGFGSGRQMYIFKVPNTETILPGDINKDGKIDTNDFTSYLNYTGLRMGDPDFDGYVSGGDVNKNGLIDAYDISVVTTQLRGGVNVTDLKPLKGSLTLTPSKTTYMAGETVEILVSGVELQAVNGLSFALPYNTDELDYIGVDSKGMLDMENLTNDRLHSNGKKSLYPTFVNLGNKSILEGSNELFVIKFTAKRNLNYNLKAIDGMLVDKILNTTKLRL